MISKSQVKLLKQLQVKKYRHKYHLFVAEGYKSVAELLQSSLPCQFLFALENRAENLQNLLTDKDSEKFFLLNEKELKEISSLSSPQGVVAVFHLPEYEAEKLLVEDKGIILLLDNIRDPGNLGTIIRVADWYGVKTLVCSPGCVDAYNAKTIQASMGSIARVRVAYHELVKILEKDDRTSYGAVLDGKFLQDISRVSSGFVVIGNESAGISDEVSGLVNEKISIQRHGHADSLNAAIAAAVILDRFRN